MRDFLRAGHFPTLIASLVHFETSFMIWVIMGGLGVLIAQDLGLSPAEKGLLVGVPLLGGAFSRVPIGLLADRYGAKRVGTITMLALTAPLGLAWLVVSDFTGLLVVGTLLGLAGSSFAVALPLASRWYPPRYQGTAMGIAAAGNSGTVLAALLAPRLGEAYGWHGVFGLAMIPVLGAAAVFFFVAKEKPVPVAAEPWSVGLKQLLRQADLWWICLLYTMTFGGYSGLSSFLGIYFADQYGVSAITAGGFVAVCAVAGSVVRPVGGIWADKVGGVRVLSAVYALVPLALIPAMIGAPMALTFGGFVAAMGCLGIGNGAVFQLVPTRFASQVGLATGVVGAAGGLGGFILPSVLGLQRAASGGYEAGFLLFALSLGYTFLCLQALHSGWRFTWLAARPVPVKA